MTYPDNKDPTAIGGTQPGTQSVSEIESKISFNIDNTKSLSEVTDQVTRSAEWHLSTITDPSRSTKFAVEPGISYYGAGSLSLLPRIGKFVFASNTNEANRMAFSVDQEGSNFYSSVVNTTLGSLNIDTVDGYELNALSPVNPSTNFSPTKPWVRKLFPSLSNKNLMTIAVLEIVQVTLLKLLDKNMKPNSETTESKQGDNDMALIIVDNQNIEDDIFRSLA